MDIRHDEKAIRDLLTTSRVVAVVGHSDKPHRPSYQIARYLRRIGYKVYAVNPELSEIDGEKCYATLKDIPEKVDIVDVFRRSEFLPEIVNEAIAVGARAVWAQFGIRSSEAARRAEDAHLPIVMDACIKVERNRLMG